MRTTILWLALVALVGWTFPTPANAVPAFARKHQFQCVVCHSAVPKVNSVGRQYKENGFRFSDEDQISGPWEWKNFFPVAVQGDLHYNADDRYQQGTFSVDAVQLFFGGPIAYRTSMYVHHHIIMSNKPGPLHEAHIRVDRPAGLPAMFHVGQFEPWLANSPGKTLLTHGFLPYAFKVGLNPDTVGDSKLGAGSVWFVGEHLRLAADLYKNDKVTSGFTRFFYRRTDTEIGALARYGQADFDTTVETGGQSGAREVIDHFSRYGIDFVTPLGRNADTYGAAYYARHSSPTGTRDRAKILAGFLETDYAPIPALVLGLRYEAIKILDKWEPVGEMEAAMTTPEGQGGHAMIVARRHTEAEAVAKEEDLIHWGVAALHYYTSQNTHVAVEYRLNVGEPSESQSAASVHFAF